MEFGSLQAMHLQQRRQTVGEFFMVELGYIRFLISGKLINLRIERAVTIISRGMCGTQLSRLPATWEWTGRERFTIGT